MNSGSCWAWLDSWGPGGAPSAPADLIHRQRRLSNLNERFIQVDVFLKEYGEICAATWTLNSSEKATGWKSALPWFPLGYSTRILWGVESYLDWRSIETASAVRRDGIFNLGSHNVNESLSETAASLRELGWGREGRVAGILWRKKNAALLSVTVAGALKKTRRSAAPPGTYRTYVSSVL